MLWTGLMNLFCYKHGPLSFGPAQITDFSKGKTCTLHEKASLMHMIIRLTHLQTLKAFQLECYRLFILKNRDELF